MKIYLYFMGKRLGYLRKGASNFGGFLIYKGVPKLHSRYMQIFKSKKANNDQKIRFMGQNAGYDMLLSPINTGRRDN